MPVQKVSKDFQIRTEGRCETVGALSTGYTLIAVNYRDTLPVITGITGVKGTSVYHVYIHLSLS